MSYSELPGEADFIDVNSLRVCCDVCYDGQDDFEEPPPGIIFMHAHWLPKFFGKFTRNRYVVVSGASDWCVCPAGGLKRRSGDWYAPSPQSECGVVVGMRNHSLYGMPTLPPNLLHWFAANCAVEHLKISWAPLGLNTGTEPLSSLRSLPKTGLLYVNFQNHSNERVWLKNVFCKDRPWATFRPKPDLSGEEFRREVAQHKFVLCTFGCGLDCHRTYEALYAGTYPVMLRTSFAENLSGLPVLLVDSYEQLTPRLLENAYGIMRATQWDYAKIYLSYWKSRVRGLWEELSR